MKLKIFVFKATLAFVAMMFSCDAGEEFIAPKKDEASFTTIQQEPELKRALDKVTPFLGQSENLRTSFSELKTDSILKIIQADSTNFTYTIAFEENEKNGNFKNLVFRRVENGFVAFVQEFISTAPMFDFKDFRGGR